jgi:hypothetical protein
MTAQVFARFVVVKTLYDYAGLIPRIGIRGHAR